MVRNVDQALGRLDGLLTEMSDFGRKLNSGEGSLGQLMRSPELYQHLNAAAVNIDNLTRELKPILADARVFSDKIARHPELLGVRGPSTEAQEQNESRCRLSLAAHPVPENSGGLHAPARTWSIWATDLFGSSSTKFRGPVQVKVLPFSKSSTGKFDRGDSPVRPAAS